MTTLSMTTACGAGQKAVVVEDLQVTAAGPGAPTVVLAKLSARSHAVNVESLHLDPGDRSGLFLDVNLCDDGTTAQPLPTITIAAHRHVRFSTAGVVAVIYRSGARLRRGDAVHVSFSLDVGGIAQRVGATGTVVARPHGLTIPLAPA